MKSRITATAVLGTALFAFGCTDAERPESPLAPGTSSSLSSASGEQAAEKAAGQQLAHAFALAMNAPDVRVQVRNAMRASPVTEHKLVLQEFVKTPGGRRLVEASAKASGVEVSTIEQLIARLPDMDFYAPFQEHRLTWKATADVFVAATMDVNTETLSGYTREGRSVTYKVADQAPAQAMLVLHPAEMKHRRINAQADRPGAVIQDPDDGEEGGRVIWISARGDTTIIDLADRRRGSSGTVGTLCETCMVQPIDEDGSGGGGGGGGASADTTYLDFAEFFSADVGRLEIVITAKYYRADGTFAGEKKWERSGLRRETKYYFREPLIFRRVRDETSERINVHVIEKDPFFDDDLGRGDFMWRDRDKILTLMEKKSYMDKGADIALGWVPIR
jgi:hypothetical protein